MFASNVVVDTLDGYMFWKGADGKLFDAATAAVFAAQRNAEMKPQYRSYRVFALEPAAPPVADPAEVVRMWAPPADPDPSVAGQVAAGQPVTMPAVTLLPADYYSRPVPAVPDVSSERFWVPA